jgi:3-phenylpropionate/trans-cinnamate dioxygenase ferredoxin subunit
VSDRHRVAALEELAEAAPHRVEVAGRLVSLVRLGETVYALGDTCSHAEVSLSDGEVDTDECALECPQHGSLFSLETGEPLSLPATRPVPVYEVTVEDGDVWITVGSGS